MEEDKNKNIDEAYDIAITAVNYLREMSKKASFSNNEITSESLILMQNRRIREYRKEIKEAVAELDKMKPIIKSKIINSVQKKLIRVLKK